MATAVTVVPAGGLPVTVATNGYGLPVTAVPAGGVPVTIVANGLPVVGGIGGSDVGPNYSILAFPANFVLTGQSANLVPPRHVTMQAGVGAFNLTGENATLTYVPVVSGGSVAMQAGVGMFTLTGEDMTPFVGYSLQAGEGDFTLFGQSANMVPPVRGVSATFVGEVELNMGSTGNSFVIASVPIGNPAYIATRRVIVVLEGVSSNGWHCLGGSIGAATIDQFTDNGYTAAGSDIVEIMSAVVTSGTTATVTVNYSGNPVGLQRLYVYICDNSRMTAPTSPVTMKDEKTDGSDVNSITFNTSALANGFIICGVWAGGGAGPTITSSTDPSTTDISDSAYMAAHINAITATASYNIQTHAPPAGGNSMLAAAAFR